MACKGEGHMKPEPESAIARIQLSSGNAHLLCTINNKMNKPTEFRENRTKGNV